MINGATVTLSGYVATEPNYRTIKGTTPIVSMRVAWTQRYLDRESGEWRDGNTSFATVNCWRKLAGNVAPSLRKGHAVVVAGRLQVRESDDREGGRRIFVEIEADAIGHDLSRGVTHFQRTLKSPDDVSADGPGTGDAIEPGSMPPAGHGADAANGAPAGSHDDLFERNAVAELAQTGDGSAEAQDSPAAVAVPF